MISLCKSVNRFSHGGSVATGPKAVRQIKIMTEPHNHSSQFQDNQTFWIRCMQSSQVAWIQEHPKQTLFGLLGFCALVIVFLSFYWKNSEKNIENYEIASVLRAKLNSQTSLFDANDDTSNNSASKAQVRALEELQAIVQSNPTLAREFDGVIAQEMVFQENTHDISSYAQVAIQSLATTKNYADFSQDSLHICQKQYQEAYEKAIKLKAVLDNEKTSQMTTTPSFALYYFNLLQIINLSKALGKSTEQQKYITELKSSLENETNKVTTLQEKESLEKITAFLQEGHVSLLDFLQNTNVVNSQN